MKRFLKMIATENHPHCLIFKPNEATSLLFCRKTCPKTTQHRNTEDMPRLNHHFPFQGNMKQSQNSWSTRSWSFLINCLFMIVEYYVLTLPCKVKRSLYAKQNYVESIVFIPSLSMTSMVWPEEIKLKDSWKLGAKKLIPGGAGGVAWSEQNTTRRMRKFH